DLRATDTHRLGATLQPDLGPGRQALGPVGQHLDADAALQPLDADETVLTLGVDQEDMGRVIGRDGRIANAIRSLLRVMATRDGRHVELEIESDAD
ncbi:MAG TPA: KH domain-containing protein, partial [Candidatus Limnocylindria bacterium]